jgi:hypothetical protein
LLPIVPATPGVRKISEYTLRVLSGSSRILRLSTTLPMVPLVVSRRGALALTSTSSVIWPTSKRRSTATALPICTTMFGRAARRKPCRLTSTRYSPGGSGSDE